MSASAVAGWRSARDCGLPSAVAADSGPCGTALIPARVISLGGALTLCLVALAFLGSARAAEPLPELDADTAEVSVSGVSSGGFMAVQFHVANSAWVRGAGVIAAGPYYCAQGSLMTALSNCMSPGAWSPVPDASTLKAATERIAATGAIDATSNLAHARVWLFSGTHDETVKPEVVAAVVNYYQKYVPVAAVAYEHSVPAGHGMVTADAGAACEVTAPPFINDCDYDAAGALLAHLHGPLQPPASVPGGRLIAFNQPEFATGDAYAISMAEEGFVYVPKACEQARCRVHVAFHGCRQGLDAVGDLFARTAGYNRWADANGFIILYPQAIARYGWGFAGWRLSFVFNPRGCWDWWGYTGPEYATRSAPQIRAVRAMLDRLAAPRPLH